MTSEVSAVSQLPRVPAIYVMYSGSPRWAAYVGVAGDLRERIGQHLIKSDSSVTTGTAAVGLNPDHVRELDWWEHPAFDQRERLEAAELVAFSVFDPALRSRGRASAKAVALAEDHEFVGEMKRLLLGQASGRLVRPSLSTVAERLDGLERRLAEVERRLSEG